MSQQVLMARPEIINRTLNDWDAAPINCQKEDWLMRAGSRSRRAIR